jgi:hypothetical protein
MTEGAEQNRPFFIFAHENHFTRDSSIAASHDDGAGRDSHKKQSARKKGGREVSFEAGVKEGDPQPSASDHLA